MHTASGTATGRLPVAIDAEQTHNINFRTLAVKLGLFVPKHNPMSSANVTDATDELEFPTLEDFPTSSPALSYIPPFPLQVTTAIASMSPLLNEIECAHIEITNNNEIDGGEEYFDILKALDDSTIQTTSSLAGQSEPASDTSSLPSFHSSHSTPPDDPTTTSSSLLPSDSSFHSSHTPDAHHNTTSPTFEVIAENACQVLPESLAIEVKNALAAVIATMNIKS